MVESKYVSGRDGTSRGSYTLVTDAGAEIKTAYEAEANAYTDTKNTKLAGIEENATAGGGGEGTVAETQGDNAAAPLSWTDLDLSARVGANSALVLLKYRSIYGDIIVAVRKNGDTDNFYNTADFSGVALTKATRLYYRVLWVATDPNGIIEWRASGSQTMQVDVIADIK